MKRRIPFVFLAWVALILTIVWSSFQTILPMAAQQQNTLTVSAAISLTNALQAIKPIYQQQHPQVSITYNFAGSGVLQRQIEQGAPVDLFISAAAKQVDALQQKNLLLPETRRNLLTNRLVLITPRNINLSSFKQLTNPEVQHLAVGEPKSVPAGQYAQELLTNLQILAAIKPKLVYGNNVRQVLTYVENGNVEAGIVYASDAQESKTVQVAATAPENLHSPIVYPVAVLKDSKSTAAAQNFVQFLSSNQAQAVFKKYGFGIAR